MLRSYWLIWQNPDKTLRNTAILLAGFSFSPLLITCKKSGETTGESGESGEDLPNLIILHI